MQNKKVIFWTIFSGVAIGGSWLIYNKFFKAEKTLTNYEDVQKNVGLSGDSEKLAVVFNGGKNQATFWNNDRVFFSPYGLPDIISKGTYSNGGKTIVLDSGKKIESSSVWANLLNAIK
jgi:hypothetical protein